MEQGALNNTDSQGVNFSFDPPLPKKAKRSLPLKQIGIFIFISVAVLTGVSIFVLGHDIINKTMGRLGVLSFGRNIGIIKVNETEFFTALEDQNLVYDYNRDQIVTGEDYSLLQKAVGADTVATITTETVAGPSIEESGASINIPSIKGFSGSEFDGTANVNVPIDLPAGPGGLTPSLSLNYSSGAVNDLQLGTHVSWGSSIVSDYQNQAGLVGLGWNLGGLGSIVRDVNDTEWNESDDKFTLSFEKGSANLVMESGDTLYSIWRTAPNLMLKVERYGNCKYSSDSAATVCRYSWTVTDGSGTKYYFGAPALVPRGSWAGSKDPDSSGVSSGSWFPLFQVGSGEDEPLGYSQWYNVTNKDSNKRFTVVYKWLLTKVESAYDKVGGADAEINYQYRFHIGNMPSTTRSSGREYFTRTAYPYSITWGANQVIFTTENRYDWQVKRFDTNPSQQMTAKKRISKITVSTLGVTRGAYKLAYTYGWKPADHARFILNGTGYNNHRNDQDCTLEAITPEVYYPDPRNPSNESAITVESEAVPGVATHSLLTEVAQYSDDPDANANAKKLPSNTFSYGPNENGFCGGSPLSAFITSVPGDITQSYLANYFFLKKADNGYGGRVEFEYWRNNSGFAIPVKYCDGDKLDPNGQTCRTDVTWNTFRHRISAKVTHDGMGKFIRTGYSYTGAGAEQGLAYVEKYYNKFCASSCPSNCAPLPHEDKCGCGGQAQCSGGNRRLKGDDLTGYEFLGYPEVTVSTYAQNSNSVVASKTGIAFHQKLETPTCFKPSPLKGVSYRTKTYDVNNSANYKEDFNWYSVRFGPMFSPISELTDSVLDANCAGYNYKSTVTLTLPTDNIHKSYVANTGVLCTRTSFEYQNDDNTLDPWATKKREINWGKVQCASPRTDNTSDKAIYNINYFTAGRNDTKWMAPRVKENWISDSRAGTKYNHSRVFYDGQAYGALGDYGNVTKNQTLVDGAVYSESTKTYDPTYPWLLTQAVDPLGRRTTVEYENRLHMYPFKVTNHLNQSILTDYDFTTGDTTHPNYGKALGVPIRTYDVNYQPTTFVYDSFGRLIHTYLPGKLPGAGVLANSFVKYIYLNETEIASCTVDNNCATNLGKELNSTLGYGPQLVVVKGTRYTDVSPYGKASMNYTYYNGLGQVIQTRSIGYDGSFTSAGIPVDGEGLKDIITSQSYTSLGAVEYQSLPYTAAPHVYASGPSGFDTRNFITDTSIKESRSFFDGFGRTSRQVSPDGSIVETLYDVNANPLRTKVRGKNCTDTSTVTPCLEVLSLSDAFGRVLEDQQIDTVNNKTLTTRYEYHPVLGGVTKTIDNKSTTLSTVEYDKLGRKTKMWDIDMSPAMTGDANSWRYTYDKLGNLTSQTDPKGQISAFTYDLLNRITRSTINSKTLLENTYDNCVYGVGRICRSVSYDLATSRAIQTKTLYYDPRGRVIKQDLLYTNLPDAAINNKTFTNEYTYDEGGRVITTKYPENSTLGVGAETVTNNYSGPYLYSLSTSNADGQYVKESRYNKYGQNVYYKLGDNTEGRYTFNDSNMRLTNLSVGPSTTTSPRFLNLGYQYDTNGNITRITDAVLTGATDSNSFNQTFTYDPLSRLTVVTGAYAASYTYDDIGNILTKVEGGQRVNLTYGLATSRFYHRPQTGSQTVGTQTTNFNFSYDNLGNLTGDGNKTYLYNENNKLVTANVPAATTPTATPIAPTATRVPTATPTRVPSGTLTPTSTALAGDANGDGRVDTADYDIWKANYGTTTSAGPVSNRGNFNSDTQVDGIDYALWRKNAVSPTTTPVANCVTNLTVNDSANRSDWSIRTNLRTGDTQFGDRAYTLVTIPGAYAGKNWIRTANDSKSYTGTTVSTFTVSTGATVYIAHDDRIRTKPSWMNGWADTGANIVNSEPTPKNFSLYSKTFSAGSTVNLGNNGTTGYNMYTVIVGCGL